MTGIDAALAALETVCSSVSFVKNEDDPLPDSYIVSSADLDAELRAMAENVNPTSPLSIMRRGRRIVSVETVEGIASQAALETHVKNRMLLSMMGAASYTFTTCGDVEQPHRLNDSILMMRDGIGLLEEQEWALDCVPGGQMTHTAKKVYYNID